MPEAPHIAPSTLSYNPDLALQMLADYERQGNEQAAVADALRAHADDHDRQATDLRAKGWQLRQKLINDGVIVVEEVADDEPPF